MHLNFIALYLIAVLSVLLLISGFILLIYGLINKQSKKTIYGSILSFIAILIITFAVFWGVRKFVRFAYFVKDKIETRHNFRPGPPCFMHMDSIMCHGDSINNNDSGRVCIEKKIIIKGKGMRCGKGTKCDPNMCQKKCPHN